MKQRARLPGNSGNLTASAPRLADWSFQLPQIRTVYSTGACTESAVSVGPENSSTRIDQACSFAVFVATIAVVEWTGNYTMTGVESRSSVSVDS
jgi:hypothetical protein